VHQRRVRAAGELAQLPVVDARAEVVRVRIIGEREVRPIEVSTSISIAASVPATISTRTGSASTF